MEEEWTQEEIKICILMLQEVCEIGLQDTSGSGISTCTMATKCCTHAAKAGNIRAQFVLGGCYLNGISQVLEKDSELAMMWITCSANQGYVDAQALLSEICIQTKDTQNGFLWCLKAANGGHVGAQYFVGFLYASGGCGHEQPNPSLAIKWFMIAIQNASVDALYALAYCLQTGYGVPADLESAKMLIDLSAQVGTAVHRHRYMHLIRQMTQVRKQQTEITKARNEQSVHEKRQNQTLEEQVDGWFV